MDNSLNAQNFLLDKGCDDLVINHKQFRIYVSDIMEDYAIRKIHAFIKLNKENE